MKEKTVKKKRRNSERTKLAQPEHYPSTAVCNSKQNAAVKCTSAPPHECTESNSAPDLHQHKLTTHNADDNALSETTTSGNHSCVWLKISQSQHDNHFIFKPFKVVIAAVVNFFLHSRLFFIRLCFFCITVQVHPRCM